MESGRSGFRTRRATRRRSEAEQQRGGQKTLEERAGLPARLAAGERKRGHDWLVKRFEERERDARQQAEVIRRFLMAEEPREESG